MRTPLAVVALFTLALLQACSTAHTARPLGEGNGALHLTIGGPVTGVGDPSIFVPLTTVTGKVGVTDRLDAYVGWHVLETFVNNGNLYFDVGASYYFLDQKGARPGLSAAFTLSPLLNKQSGWASFDLQITASWYLDKKERHLLYVGLHNYFTPVRSQLLPNPPYTLSPYIGGQLRVGKKRNLGLGIEVKWHRPWANTGNAVLGYAGFGNQGALAFLGGVTVYIEGKKSKARALEAATAAPPPPADPVESAPTPGTEPTPAADPQPESTPAPSAEAGGTAAEPAGAASPAPAPSESTPAPESP